MRILYLDLDTLRPDHLGCYGYLRNTSPNIDRIASEGVRFENYYTADAPCLPSRSALFNGRFGIHTGIVGHGGTAADLRLEGRDRSFGSRPQFATWMKKLKSIPEGDSKLLDNSMIVYGAGLSDGNRHSHDDLPTIIAGRAGGSIQPGRRIVYRRETPMSNLFLNMMDRMGVQVDHFGDATGRLDGLDLS